MMFLYASAFASWPVAKNRRGLIVAVQRSRGNIDVLVANGRHHFINANPARRQAVGIHLHPYGVFLRASDHHLRHAA